jgi:trimethylamine:corrinoid methyltransferase-like protein
MTDGEVPRRRRGGGREGHERNVLPVQRPWAQPRLRYRPTEVVSADELESIHVASLRVLEEIGMDFLDAEARELLAAQAVGANDDCAVRCRGSAWRPTPTATSSTRHSPPVEHTGTITWGKSNDDDR